MTKRVAMDAGVPFSVPMVLGCSMSAGAVAQTVVYPLDLIRRRIQLGTEATAMAASDYTWLASLRTVLQQDGIKGVFAGIVPTYAKVVPSVMIAKTVGDTLVAYGKENGWS